MVVAAPGAIEQVLDNLLDNAVTICSPRGEVWISLRTDGEAAVLTVADDGPGLTEEERANATKRFWRKGHDRSGSGLGLAIVLALVNASGGSLRLGESESGGLAVTARFATSGASHSASQSASHSASQSASASPSVLPD
jgi:signal transduction histidine kinase